MEPFRLDLTYRQFAILLQLLDLTPPAVVMTWAGAAGLFDDDARGEREDGWEQHAMEEAGSDLTMRGLIGPGLTVDAGVADALRVLCQAPTRISSVLVQPGVDVRPLEVAIDGSMATVEPALDVGVRIGSFADVGTGLATIASGILATAGTAVPDVVVAAEASTYDDVIAAASEDGVVIAVAARDDDAVPPLTYVRSHHGEFIVHGDPSSAPATPTDGAGLTAAMVALAG